MHFMLLLRNFTKALVSNWLEAKNLEFSRSTPFGRLNYFKRLSAKEQKTQHISKLQHKHHTVFETLEGGRLAGMLLME